LDSVALRYASRVSGLTELVLTKIDVLSGLDEIKIATAYDVDGQATHLMPPETAPMERAQPIYETLPGWQADIAGVRRRADLPEDARHYVERIEEAIGLPITMISVGPERDQAILG
jgi:adenylosuccinate synthase